jgi:hypothetical protein
MKKLLPSLFVILLLCSAQSTKAQVYNLNSYPSASAVIFLDFDGQTVPAGAWYGTDLYCASSGLTNPQITEAFNRVAEDYRPFNINITTDSTKYFAAPADKRMRVIVTPTNGWYGPAGGVAYVYSFTYGDDTPCFVFTSQLAYNPKYVAEAASHEAGHTLGLFHQSVYNGSCVKTAEYNPGTGAGEIGWAPIMGVGYSKNQTTWYNGPNTNGCNVMQSDLDIIIDPFNGFTYRTDDYASNFAGATNIPFVSNAFNTTGEVEQNTDADFVKFTTTAFGRFQLSAIPVNVGANNSGSNLDIQVNLYNNAQVLLNIYNPATLLSASIDSFMNAGTYYLKIEGKGNINAPGYASLGAYTLQGNFTPGALPLRRLELQGAMINDEHRLNWIIEADEQVTKQILEFSTDGRNFNQLTQSPVASRAYTYYPHINGTVLYRLNVTFDNGRQFNSNIIAIGKNKATAGPVLISNFINTGAIVVSSPGNYDYAIYDLNGKTLMQGKMTNGTTVINSEKITSGMYIVRFTNETELYTEKFVKQ